MVKKKTLLKRIMIKKKLKCNSANDLADDGQMKIECSMKRQSEFTEIV